MKKNIFGFSKKPNFSGELLLMRRGVRYIAGVDEVGCGPIAGPVIAASVILNHEALPDGLDDSKRLSARKRAVLYDVILSKALAVSVAGLSACSIDKSGIRFCSLEAMRRSIDALSIPPDYVLVDGCSVPHGLSCSASAWIKGDQRFISIAAASIIAKVVRDRMMVEAGIAYPLYQMERHVGYATVMHRQRLHEKGPVRGLHRYSFAPIKWKLLDEVI
ncbi:MAG: ribonuclease HII [Candidatus Tokpelaia sp. JSC161]|jgi:ribonuclease HII|nr:MAG: ribonuclease HII [Candidatus Tokpelaia sp. JSC161]